MSQATYYIGDTRKVVDSLPAGSVDLILTSPPFLALRSYLPADHPDKALEIGSEATPADFLDTLLDLTESWARVLAPHGSLVVELGDTYSGVGGTSSAPNPAYGEARSMERKEGDLLGAGNGWRKADDLKHWPLPKSLAFIPQLYGASLAYGRNLLRPERTTEPWRVRNVIAWCRPNPPVGALGDKFRPATSYMTVATKARDRYFDLDAVRTEPTVDPSTYSGNGYTKGNAKGNGKSTPMAGNPAGAPPLDWWEIPTEPYSGSHYATWPRRLLTRPILAMCPERVCTVCGQPSRRIVDVSYVDGKGNPAPGEKWSSGIAEGKGAHANKTAVRTTTTITTLGWSDCNHNAWRNGVVLDPFGGSGTTGAVATGHGRDCWMVDLDERNADLARERIGMFLTVVDTRADADAPQ